MRENYAPWDIKVGDFPRRGSKREKILFILKFAVLAPSGHNSQPWEFIVGDGFVEVFINLDRSLRKSDPERRQLFLGLGCAIENLTIAADYFGYDCRIIYPRGDFLDSGVARIDLIPDLKEVGKDHLIFSIPKRITNRNPYKSDPLSRSFIDSITNLSNNEIHIDFIEENRKKIALAEIIKKSQIEIMNQKYFRKELSEYIKSNFTYSKFGMPGFTQGIPGLISFFAPTLIKIINFSKKNEKKDDKLLKLETPSFLVVSSKSDRYISRLESGRIFERVWLMGEAEGIKLSPLAAPTQVGNYWQEVQNILGVEFRPQIVSRIGYCSVDARHTPRFSVEEVIINGA